MIMMKTDRDCFNCCISELIGVKYEDVPDFWSCCPKELGSKISNEESDAYFDAIKKWLDSIGYLEIRFPVEWNKDEKFVELPYVSKKPYMCMATLTKKDRPYSHAIVLKVSDVAELLDPKEESDYTIEDITHVSFFIKKESF